MKLRINEKDISMKYKTYDNIEKCFNILVNEKGYSKEEAQDIIDHMLIDYKYNPNSNDSLLRRINLVLSKDEYAKEFGITERYTRLKEKETPNIEVKDSKFTNNTIMIITIFSGISSDGCDIEIVNGNKVLFKDSYRYGYNASYNRKFAKYAHQDVINAQKYGRTGYIERPYIGDIITELCKKYNIDKHDIIFKQGKNVFNGDNVSSKKVSDFINNHIDGIVEESYKKLKEQNVDIEVKHKGILEVPEGKNVDDLPLSHFVNLANKKGLSKITKALNNLQVWNKNDDPKLSKWAGDMIDKLNKKLKKDESISVKEANNGLYVIKKDNKYVKDFSNGEEFTKQYDKAEKFTDKQSANEYAAKYSKWYGKGYKVVTISSVSENVTII